jgi:hypothetical protein
VIDLDDLCSVPYRLLKFGIVVYEFLLKLGLLQVTSLIVVMTKSYIRSFEIVCILHYLLRSLARYDE